MVRVRHHLGWCKTPWGRSEIRGPRGESSDTGDTVGQEQRSSGFQLTAGQALVATGRSRGREDCSAGCQESGEQVRN